ncbi:MAG: matrixin family metalloprotease [Bacteriovorax sp.]|jgi:hypothetical protein
MKSILGFTLFTALLLSSCKQTTTSLSAAPRILPGSCNIGKWTNLASPLNLKMSADFSTDYTNADLVGGLNPLEQMAKAWNDSVTPTTSFFQLPFAATATSGFAELSDFRDSELGIYKSFNWFPNVSSNALAITLFYGVVRSDASLGTFIDLTHADIIINYRDYAADFTMTGNPMIDYDVPTIVLHEMGHFLGLCHENSANSIMAPYYFTTQRSLKTFDTNKIQALYLNNQNYSAMTTKSSSKIISSGMANGGAGAIPVGTEVKGIIELSANGHCKHFINGKLVHEHD